MSVSIGKRKVSEFVKINHLKLDRTNGSHKIYKTQEGRTISLKDKMSEPVMRRLAKQYNLTLNI